MLRQAPHRLDSRRPTLKEPPVMRKASARHILVADQATCIDLKTRFGYHLIEITQRSA